MLIYWFSIIKRMR